MNRDAVTRIECPSSRAAPITRLRQRQNRAPAHPPSPPRRLFDIASRGSTLPPPRCRPSAIHEAAIQAAVQAAVGNGTITSPPESTSPSTISTLSRPENHSVAVAACRTVHSSTNPYSRLPAPHRSNLEDSKPRPQSAHP